MSFRDAAAGHTWPAYDHGVKVVMRELKRNPRLRTAQLASIVRLNPDYLARVFKKQVGMALSSYTKGMQLHRACKLLRTTCRSIKEIRHEVGIPDGANFVRHFKLRYGATPSLFRKSKVGFD